MSRGIPEWLQPHKNEWLSQGMLQKMFWLQDNKSFVQWFKEVKPRVRQISEDSNNQMGKVTRYLVKHVWAMSLAHNVKLMPSGHYTPIEALRFEIESLKRELEAERGKLKFKVIEVDKTQGSVDLLRLLATSTEARQQAGVYFLLGKRDEIVYVGQSKNVLSRMAGHYDKEFSSVRMVRIDDPKRRSEVEAKLIALFVPKNNMTLTGISRSERAGFVSA